MKKAIGISLFIFFTIASAVLISGLVFNKNNNINIQDTTGVVTENTQNIKPVVNKPTNTTKPITSPTTNPINNPVVAPVTSPVSQKILNMNEIAKHNNINDCYMLIGGKVYDITNYFGSHPGGDRSMVPYCGKEATEAYNTRGGNNGSHSSYAVSLLGQYYIGNLNQVLSQ